MIRLIIPIGGTYINEEKTYTEGEVFPQSIKNGDVYIYRDYEYKYNYKASLLKYINSKAVRLNIKPIEKKLDKYMPVE